MASARIAFGVLGALEAYRDGQLVPLPGLRQRAVLAALLVHAGRPVSGDVLIDAAWPEGLPEHPRAALNTVLSRLRSALGTGTIRSEPAGFRLVVDPDSIDAERFTALRARAGDAPTGEALALLDTALSLWRGRAYEEVADRDFAAAEAARLDELRLTCIEDVAELRLEAAESAAAAATLEAFVGEHPMRERAQALLMTALYRAGRVSEASETFHRYGAFLAEEVGLDPSPALRELHRSIISHEMPSAAAPRRTPEADATRDPATEAALFGRDDETAELLELTDRHRLVTVTGPGGVGKTRLVTDALPALTERSGKPAVVVELASVTADDVYGAITGALRIGPAPHDPQQAALEYLSVVPTLLVLDNCEHVRPAVHSFARAALRHCPGLHLIATSRTRVGLAAEQVLPLEPLPVPAASADPRSAERAAPVQLFVDRARRARPSFAVSADAVPAVTEICRRLDGLPLAIELAATRAVTLGIDALRERLDRALDLLSDGGLGEGSLRATLDWSYHLLDESERIVFTAIGVFESDFDLDAAEEVAGATVGGPVACCLATLVEASLVATHGDAATRRYRLLETVREFAREHLRDSGIEHDVRRDHARWVRSTVRTAADSARGPTAGPLVPDVADIRAAVAWSLQKGDAQLAGEISGFLMLAANHGRPRFDLIEIVRQVASAPAVEATPGAALAKAAGAFAATFHGDLETAEKTACAALDTVRTVDERFLSLASFVIMSMYRGDREASRQWCRELLGIRELPPARQVDGHASLALLSCYEGDLTSAREQADIAVTLAETCGSAGPLAFARYAAAEVAVAADPATAVPLLRTAARDADRAGAEFEAGLAETALVAAVTRLGRTAEAREIFGPLLHRWLRLAVWPQLWTTMRILAELLADTGRPETAALLLGAAAEAPSAPAVTGRDTQRYDALAERLRVRIGPRTHEKIMLMTRILSRTQVVERAIAAVAPRLRENA